MMKLRFGRLSTALVVTSIGVAVSLSGAATSASAKTPKPPKTGSYKGTTSQGTPIRFRVAKTTCAPPVRGGNQHQKHGYCFVPSRTSPAITEVCPSGFVYHDIYSGLFELLMSSKGKLTFPETGYTGGGISVTGVFSVTVTSAGRASGYLDQTEIHALDSGTTEKCPSGRVKFTAKHA